MAHQDVLLISAQRSGALQELQNEDTLERTASPPRMSHLDGLRFFAFLGVFLAHSLHVPLLWSGVDCFFVLSGYLISGILLRSRDDPQYFSNFYRRRFVRIFPPYYLFLLLIFFVFGNETERGSAPYFFLYLSNFNSALHLAPYPAALSAMWSLAIEEQFYVLWPFVVRRLGEPGLLRLSVLLLIVSPVARLVVTMNSSEHWPTYYLTLCRVDLLAAGTVLAIAQRQLSASRILNVSRYGLGLATAGFQIFSLLSLVDPLFRTGANSILFNTVGYSLIMLIMMGFLSYLIPREKGFLGRTLSWKPFVYLGVISYGLYLYHEVVLDRIRHFGIWMWPAAALALAITISVAAISWHVVEKPLQRFKAERNDRRNTDTL